MTVLPGPLVARTDRQGGAISRAQLHEAGVTRHLIRSQVRSHRWQLVGPRVVVMHCGPLTREQRWWVALLHAGPLAVLAGPTACEADGLRGYEVGGVHIFVPKGVRVPLLGGLTTHQTRRLPDHDIHPVALPRRTRLPRSLVDAAGWASDGDRAVALLAAAVQQRLVAAAQLRTALEADTRVLRRHLMLLAVADIEGGAQSLAEIDAVALCRRTGLPPPDLQSERWDTAGRRRWLDMHWRRWKLTAEIDGAAHREVRQWWADMARQNDVVLGDSLVLRFPAMVLRLHPEQFTDQVRRGLAAGGWPG